MEKQKTYCLKFKMECRRCGKCCYFTLKNGLILKCKYLIKMNKSKTSFCRIFKSPSRIGKVIYLDEENLFSCVPIELSKCQYEN